MDKNEVTILLSQDKVRLILFKLSQELTMNDWNKHKSNTVITKISFTGKMPFEHESFSVIIRFGFDSYKFDYKLEHLHVAEDEETEKIKSVIDAYIEKVLSELLALAKKAYNV